MGRLPGELVDESVAELVDQLAEELVDAADRSAPHEHCYKLPIADQTAVPSGSFVPNVGQSCTQCTVRNWLDAAGSPIRWVRILCNSPCRFGRSSDAVHRNGIQDRTDRCAFVHCSTECTHRTIVGWARKCAQTGALQCKPNSGTPPSG